MQIKPLKIVILYIIFSVVWIIIWHLNMEDLKTRFKTEPGTITNLKSLVFVIVTSWLLYYLIKKQQHVLLNSERQYRSLFYTNPNPQWIYDKETLKFLEVNEAAIRVYGYTEEEFKKMTILDIRKMEDHPKVEEKLKDYTAHVNVSGNWEHIKKNGVSLIAHVNSHQTTFHNRHAVLVMAQDVTLQLQQEEKLQMLYAAEKELKEELERNIELIEHSLKEKQKFAEIVDRIHNMVIITDADGVILWVNQAFLNTTGYSLEETVGKTPDFLHGPNTDVSIQAKIWQSVKENPFSVFEILNYTKAGDEYWIEMTVSAIYNDENEIIRYISVENVITERKLRDQQILKQNEVLKTLAWANSHAIRKPVVSLLSLVELSKDLTQLRAMKEVHVLIGVCAKELDEVTKEVAKVIQDSEPDKVDS
jgi:PAS domain S-box-containing protein